MWERLIAVKRHREQRLRTEIAAINGKIEALKAEIESLIHERAEVIQTWRQRSAEQNVYQEDKLNQLRRELSGYHTEAGHLQREREEKEAEIKDLEQQRTKLSEALRQCIAKQEKLQLLQKEHHEHRSDSPYR